MDRVINLSRVDPPVHELGMLKCRYCRSYFQTYHDYLLHSQVCRNKPRR